MIVKNLFVIGVFLPALAFGQDMSPTKTTDADQMSTTNSANDVAIKKSKSKTERIGITGSRIKKIDTEGPKSIIVMDNEALVKTGATTINEALNTLTVASFGSSTYGSSYGSGEGVQSVSLRGLGSSNTLVLLNGKRLAKDPYLQLTDLSTIPIAAVDRVEILKGTASAVYGSDALGGVVNIITKKDFQGFGFGGGYTQPRYKGGEASDLFAVSGVNTNNIQNLTVMNYSHKSPTLLKDRPWVNTAQRSDFGAPGSYLGVDGKYHAIGACPEGETNTRIGQNCEFNDFPYREYTGEMNKLSMLNDFTYTMSSRLKLGVRVIAAQTASKTHSSPTALDYSDGYAVSAGAIEAQGLDLKVAPSVDQNGNVPIRFRLVEDSGRIVNNDNLTTAATAAANYEVTPLSNLEVSVSESRISISTFWSNFFDDNLLKDAVRSGKFNVFADEGNRGSVDAYKTDAPSKKLGYIRSYDLIYSGDTRLFGYAVGSSLSEEGYSSEVADQTAFENVKGLGGGGGEGTRSATAVFAEASVPLFDHKVEVNVAGRFDNYSDFGSTTNPALGALYRPTNSLLFKTQYGTGFKAPSLDDINGKEARYYNTVFDHKNCNEARATANAENTRRYCEGNTSVETLGGGNKELKPEKTVNYSLFAGFEPISGTGLGVEYWNTIITDVISSPDTDEIMKLEAQGKPLPDGVYVERDAAGDVSRVITPTTNLASVKASGLDNNVYWKDRFSFGTFGVSSTYSYMLSYQDQKLAGIPYEEVLGQNGKPRWRWNNTFSYGVSKNVWSLSSQSRAGYEKNDKRLGNVGSFTQWDANWSYAHPFGGSIDVGGLNIFNQGYPLDSTDGVSRGGAAFGATGVGPTFYTRYTQVL